VGGGGTFLIKPFSDFVLLEYIVPYMFCLVNFQLLSFVSDLTVADIFILNHIFSIFQLIYRFYQSIEHDRIVEIYGHKYFFE